MRTLLTIGVFLTCFFMVSVDTSEAQGQLRRVLRIHRSVQSKTCAQHTSAEARIQSILRCRGFPTQIITQGPFRPEDFDPFILEMEWLKVKGQIERVIKDHLGIDTSIIIAVETDDGGNIDTFFGVANWDGRIGPLLRRAFNRADLRVGVLKPVWETRTFKVTGFKTPELFEEGHLKLWAVYSALESMMLEDGELREYGRLSSGEIVPDPQNSGVFRNRVGVAAKWQLASSAYKVRYYWRCRVIVRWQAHERGVEYWQVAPAIEFGKQERGQSAQQIRAIGTTESFVNLANNIIIPASAEPGLLTATYKARHYVPEAHPGAANFKSKNIDSQHPSKWSKLAHVLRQRTFVTLMEGYKASSTYYWELEIAEQPESNVAPTPPAPSEAIYE